MAVLNVDHHLKFILQMTYIKRPQEMKKHVKSVDLSKWIMFVRIVEQPIPFTGVVRKIMQISTMLRVIYNLLLNPSLMVE